MNVIIIEDEKPSARRLQRMLDKIGVLVEVMKMVATGKCGQLHDKEISESHAHQCHEFQV